MPKRKTYWKKQNPHRNKAYERLRELPDGGLETVTLRNGAQIIVNPFKHFLLGKMYVNSELQGHLVRKIGRYAVGDQKFAELEKAAQEKKVSAEVKVEVKGEENNG